MIVRLLAKYGTATSIDLSLFEVSWGDVKTTPTIAAGDFQISKDDGAFANLATLPAETPASSGSVKVALSAAEMTCGEATIRGVDQTTAKEWMDVVINIETYGHPSAKHPDLGAGLVQYGTAQAGAASTITLATSASTTANIYNGMYVYIVSGTGAGQVRTIVAYSTGRVATVDKAWVTNPDNTSVYFVTVSRSLGSEGLEVDYSTPANDWLVREAWRIILSSAAAELSGASGTTINIRDILDTKNRISATLDADGNRTNITFDKS